MKFMFEYEFNKPQNIPDLYNEPLVVHKRDQLSFNRDLIIFVHGLGGDRYDTWENFPKFLYEDLSNFDIGLYYYRTSWRRLNFTASVDLEDEALVLADIIRDADYDRIILIGHSMGGVLCKAAIKDLITRNDQIALNRLSCLFLIASPQAGSRRVPRILSWLSRDFFALYVHNKLLTVIEEIFTNRVTVEANTVETDKFVIPTWAILSVEDFWVDSLSAGLNLQSSRKIRVRGSHKMLAKPESKDDDSYIWILRHIRECLNLPLPAPEVIIPHSYSTPLYQDVIRRDSDLKRLYKAVMEAPIVLVEGVVGSGKSHIVSRFIQTYGRLLYRKFIWYTPPPHGELQQFFHELKEYKFDFSGHSDYSITNDFIRFLHTNNLLLVIYDYQLVNYESYLPLIRFSYNNPGPARIILITSSQIDKGYHSINTVNIEGYADDEALQLLKLHNLTLTENQFKKLKSQTSLLPFAVDLFISLCTSYLYLPDNLLEGHLPPHDLIKAWVSCILKSFSEQEKFALQFLSLNDGPFDSSLISWVVDRHLKDINEQNLLSAISKPFLLKWNSDKKLAIFDILIQYYKEVSNPLTKKVIYESLANYYHSIYQDKLADPKSWTAIELINISKACEFYQICGLFDKSNYIITKISLALKLTGQHTLLLKLCDYEIKHNKNRNSWIDLNYAQTCLAVGRVKDSFKILKSLVDTILFMDEKNVNKQIVFIRIFCEALIYLKNYPSALNILFNAFNVLQTHKAKWNVYSHAKSIISYLYILNGETQKAIELNLNLIKECTMGNHPHGVAIAKTRIGIAYNKEEDYRNAISYLSEAADVFASYDIRGLSWAKLHLSRAYYELGDISKAESNLSMALDTQLEHNFIGDDYYDSLCYFEKLSTNPDILNRIILEKKRIASIEEHRNIEPEDIVLSEILEALYLFGTETDGVKDGKSLSFESSNAKIRSPIIKTFVNAASRTPTTLIRKLFEQYEPIHIFSKPLFNKFISEACKREPHLILKYIKPFITIIKSKSDSIKLHYARLLEYNKRVTDALSILDSISRKDGFNYYNIMANCLYHTDFVESMEYNKKAMEATHYRKNKTKLFTNMANLIYKYNVMERYLEAIDYCEKAIELRDSPRFHYPVELLIKIKVAMTGKDDLNSMLSDIKLKYSVDEVYLSKLLPGITDRGKRNILRNLIKCS